MRGSLLEGRGDVDACLADESRARRATAIEGAAMPDDRPRRRSPTSCAAHSASAFSATTTRRRLQAAAASFRSRSRRPSMTRIAAELFVEAPRRVHDDAAFGAQTTTKQRVNDRREAQVVGSRTPERPPRRVTPTYQTTNRTQPADVAWRAGLRPYCLWLTKTPNGTS
jgi:hypothetical protein